MIKVVGIRFRNAGKIYYFDPLDIDFSTGDHAIVETARGIEYGTVMIAPREVEDDKVIQPLKPVIRRATPQDDQTVIDNREKEKHAYKVCMEKIAKHELQMKLVQAEYTFDNNKLLFYFTADGRIDFRELVKDLASVFRTRIELRQIGVRDETKMLGGIGICGRELCCCTYLSDFVPVSIKMAKEQNLSLNPTKISGVCGRLMCCLKNEEDTYEYLNSRLPSVGDIVTTGDGYKGEVTNVNVLRQKVKVLVEVDDEKELREYEVEELSFKPRRRNTKISEKELKELEGLEDEGTTMALDEPQQPQENKPEKKNHGKQRYHKEKDREFRDQKDTQEHKEPRSQKDAEEQKEHGREHQRDNHKDHKDQKDKNFKDRNFKDKRKGNKYHRRGPKPEGQQSNESK